MSKPKTAADAYIGATYARPNSKQGTAPLRDGVADPYLELAQGDNADTQDTQDGDSDVIVFNLIPESNEQGGTPAASTATPPVQTAEQRERGLLDAIDAAVTESDMLAALRAFIDGRDADSTAQEQQQADEQRRASERAEQERTDRAAAWREHLADDAKRDREARQAAKDKEDGDNFWNAYFGANYGSRG